MKVYIFAVIASLVLAATYLGTDRQVSAQRQRPTPSVLFNCPNCQSRIFCNGYGIQWFERSKPHDRYKDWDQAILNIRRRHKRPAAVIVVDRAPVFMNPRTGKEERENRNEFTSKTYLVGPSDYRWDKTVWAGR